MQKTLHVFITTILILIFSGAPLQAQDWHSANGSATVTTLNEVHLISANVAYSVGNRGGIIKSADGGESWTDISYGDTKDFQSVYFIDENTGFVGAPFSSGEGGSSEMFAKTIDGGESWEVFSSFDFDDFHDMEFQDAQTGWAASVDGKILHTSDGGETWESKSAGTEDLLDITLLDEDTFWVAGENGSLFRSEDGGDTWESAIQIDTLGFSEFEMLNPTDHLRGIEFVDENLGFAIGVTYRSGFVGFLLKTTDGGQSWSLLDYEFQHIFSDIEIGDNDEIVLAGGKDQFTESGSNAIYISEDEGASWKVISDGSAPLFWSDISHKGDSWLAAGAAGATTTFSLSDDTLTSDLITGLNIADISFSTPDNGAFVTGGHVQGRIFTTSDGGDNWTQSLSLAGRKAFSSVNYVDEDNIWAIGSDFYTGDSRWLIYHSSDNGTNWTKVEPDIPEFDQLDEMEKMQFLDAQTGFILAGDIFMKTTDGGNNWEELAEPSELSYSSFSTFYFTDEQNGWMARNDEIIATNDGGSTWQVKYEQDNTDSDINELLFVNTTTGYVIKDRGDMMKTEDGGDSWEELSTFSNFDLHDLHFISPDSGYVVGKGGRILTTADGGENFSVNYKTTAETLNSITLVDDDKGWIAGNNGVLLSTTNGGGIATSIRESAVSEVPGNIKLFNNYPNPFNPTTIISFQLPQNAEVHLEVFNMLGQRVATLLDGEHKSSGTHEISFNAKNLSSGIYLYRLTAGTEVITKKLTLIK